MKENYQCITCFNLMNSAKLRMILIRQKSARGKLYLIKKEKCYCVFFKNDIDSTIKKVTVNIVSYILILKTYEFIKKKDL